MTQTNLKVRGSRKFLCLFGGHYRIQPWGLGQKRQRWTTQRILKDKGMGMKNSESRWEQEQTRGFRGSTA